MKLERSSSRETSARRGAGWGWRGGVQEGLFAGGGRRAGAAALWLGAEGSGAERPARPWNSRRWRQQSQRPLKGRREKTGQRWRRRRLSTRWRTSPSLPVSEPTGRRAAGGESAAGSFRASPAQGHRRGAGSLWRRERRIFLRGGRRSYVGCRCLEGWLRVPCEVSGHPCGVDRRAEVYFSLYRRDSVHGGNPCRGSFSSVLVPIFRTGGSSWREIYSHLLCLDVKGFHTCLFHRSDEPPEGWICNLLWFAGIPHPQTCTEYPSFTFPLKTNLGKVDSIERELLKEQQKSGFGKLGWKAENSLAPRSLSCMMYTTMGNLGICIIKPLAMCQLLTQLLIHI